MSRDESSRCELTDALETLRAGDDLTRPEFRPLAEALARDERLAERHARRQRLDESILDALHDLDVPADLADRLRVSLAAAELDEAPRAPTVEVAAPRRMRRRAMIGALAVSAAVAVAVGVAMWPRANPEVGPESILQAALELPTPDMAGGRKLFADQPADEFLPPVTVVMSIDTRWIRQTFLGRPTMIYDLTLPGQVRAMLYVTQVDGSFRAPELVMLPQAPLEGVLTTGGRTACTWTDGGRLFVLVVEGDGRALRGYVRHPGSMAWQMPAASGVRS